MKVPERFCPRFGLRVVQKGKEALEGGHPGEVIILIGIRAGVPIPLHSPELATPVLVKDVFPEEKDGGASPMGEGEVVP